MALPCPMYPSRTTDIIESFVFTPESITADSIFGTEENYQLLEGAEIESFLKFPAFHSEGTKKIKAGIYRKENK